MVPGQELSSRDQADFLALLRYEDELDAFGAVGGAGVVGLDVEVEVDDPFGLDGGDFRFKGLGFGRVRIWAALDA